MKTVPTVATGTRFVQKLAIAQRFDVAAVTIKRDVALLKAKNVPGFSDVAVGAQAFGRTEAYWIAYSRLLREPVMGLTNHNGDVEQFIYQAALRVAANETTIEKEIEDLPNGKDFIASPGF